MMKHDIEHFLLDVRERLLDGNVAIAMDRLMWGLWNIRQAMPSEDWMETCDMIRAHPIAETILEDPFTQHAHERPRGFPGDAELLDYIYDGNHHASARKVSPLGVAICQSNLQEPTCRAVRARRMRIASYIAASQELWTSPNILSVACGHLRELDDMTAAWQPSSGRFVAMDQDEQAVKRCQDRFGPQGVEAVQSNVLSLLRGSRKLGTFHLVYASGLFDYLQDRTAARLIEAMFQMLCPGGLLVVPNFAPDILGCGYMETFMRWDLIYRNESQLLEFTRHIPPQDVQMCTTEREPNGNIVFLEITRKSEEPNKNLHAIPKGRRFALASRYA